MKTLALGLLATVTAFGAPPTHLTVEPSAPFPIKVGGMGDAVVAFSVAKGFHIQANPASMPNLVATKVDVSAVENVKVGNPVYPPAKPYKVAGIATVNTFDGRVEVRIPLEAGASAQPGKTVLEGKIRYQACDDKICFQPTVAKFQIPVEILR